MRRLDVSVEQRASLLARFPLFQSLSEADRKGLARSIPSREYGGGETLFTQGEAAEGFFCIFSGNLKVYRVAQQGREQVLRVLGPGTLCGEVPVFEGEHYPASAAATDTARVLYVPRTAFLNVARERPDVLLGMLAVLSRRLRGFVGLIDDLSLKEVSARLAKYLVDRSFQAGSNEFRLDTTKAVLASKLGTVAETLSRTLGKMQERGIIEVDGREIRVLDGERLHALASGEKL
jgi:CRP/FNR family transcriptional regulator